MAVYGIDFGTAETSIATQDLNGNAIVIPNQNDCSDTLASVVWFESDNNVVVGEGARDMIEEEGDKVVECIKYELGKMDTVKHEFYGKTYTAVDISAMILKQLKCMADEQGYIVQNVVATCPAYFGMYEKVGLMDAIRAAGMNLVQMLPEPVAAVWGYMGSQYHRDCTVLVCDLGGNTFDATLLRITAEEANGKLRPRVKILDTDGSDRLGGRNWNKRLFEYILRYCAVENGLSEDEINGQSRQCIRRKVEAAKKRLTTADSTRVRGLMINGIPTMVSVTREEFESITADLVERSMAHVENLLCRAGENQPDFVMLAGGAVQMPMIRNALESRFPGIVRMNEPSTIIARGAVVYASMMDDECQTVPEPVKKDDPEQGDNWICGTDAMNPLHKTDEPELQEICFKDAGESIGPVYGIDFGVTEVCIAKTDTNGNAVVIPNYILSSDTFTSAVWFESSDNVVVGAIALDVAETEGDRIVDGIRREIGQADAAYREFDGHWYNPEEIAAIILKHLCDMAGDQGEKVKDVVATCPTYFGLQEKAALLAAIEMAGMNPVQLIPEPVAVVLSYYQGALWKEEHTVLVCDLGGATFDVTMLRLTTENVDGIPQRKIKVLSTGGNDCLGGRDWDERLFEYILKCCAEENGLSEDEIDDESRQNIRRKVERTKKRLNTADSTRVRGLLINGIPTSVTVTREEFEAMTHDLASKTMSYVQQMIGDTGMEPDIVLLSGGAVLMPMICNAIEAQFPDRVWLFDPHTAVARGAAICGRMFTVTDGLPVVPHIPNRPKPPVKPEPPKPEPPKPEPPIPPVRDIPEITVAPHSYGVKIMTDGQECIWNVIKKGDRLPVKVEQHYITVRKGQEKIVVNLFENNSTADEVPIYSDTKNHWQPIGKTDKIRWLGNLELKFGPNVEPGMSVVLAFRFDREDGFRVEVERAPVAVRTAIRFAD